MADDFPFEIKRIAEKSGYECVKRLGEGASGNAYLLHHHDTNHNNVLKVIGEEKCMFKAIPREVANMLKVSYHHNIIQLEDVIYKSNIGLLLVMEHYSDMNLHTYLSKHHPLSEDTIRFIFAQVVFALDFCHMQSICHRDIKPGNIIIGDNLLVKICDFGWSKDLDLHSDMKTMAGTPLFAAPEVLLHGGVYTEKADCWSLGVVLYYLLFNVTPYTQRPWSRSDETQISKMAANGEWDFPPENDERFIRRSEGAKDLLRRLLVVDPEQRYSARQILQHQWMFELNPGFVEYIQLYNDSVIEAQQANQELYNDLKARAVLALDSMGRVIIQRWSGLKGGEFDSAISQSIEHLQR